MGLLAGRKNRTAVRSSDAFIIETFYLQVTFEQAINDMIVERLDKIAKKYNATSAQVALAWQYTKEYISASIVGDTKLEQLYDLIGSLNVKHTEEDIMSLVESYVPINLIRSD